MARTLTLRLDDESYNLFAEVAKAEGQPVSTLIRTAALAKIREKHFVDASEMAEIRNDEALLDRLKRGSRDAHNMRGSSR